MAEKTSQMIALLSRMRKEMNGAVADSMFCYGKPYGLNYGVSLPTVRSIARCEERSNDLADYLRHGREIEFAYKGRQYSITNHSGFWHLCDDTDHILLETVCQFEEKETLVARIAIAVIGDLTIQQIFDKQVYDTDKLSII